MKKFLVVVLFSVVSLYTIAQDMPVKIVRHNTGNIEWEILDEHYMPLFADNEFQTDTVIIQLKGNTRFFLHASITDTFVADTSLLVLYIDNDDIITVPSTSAGDLFLPFHTGIKNISGNKIMGGETVNIANFPWQILLTTVDTSLVCGGTIIAKDWIVTAAHCTYSEDNKGKRFELDASKFLIIAGKTNPYMGASTGNYYASEIIRHENYDDETYENDIALIHLTSPIHETHSRTIRMVTAGDAEEGLTDPGVMATISGWGLFKVGASGKPDTLPWRLQAAQVPIISKATAATVWNPSQLPKNNIFAGYRNGSKDACSGDSGGPMVISDGGEHKLAGIISWGSLTCNTYGGYTKVSAFIPWIKEKTGISTFTPPIPEGDTYICQNSGIGNYSVKEVDGATNYTWGIAPKEAGTITSNGTRASVKWDPSFSGDATVKVKTTVDGNISEWARLNVTVVHKTKIDFISNDQSVQSGNNVDLKVSASGSELEYQWYKDDDPVLNSNSATLSFPNVTASDIGRYHVYVKGYCGNDISEKSYLYVANKQIRKSSSIYVWPSVNSGEFTIAIETDNTYNIFIYNTIGKMVKSITDCQYRTDVDITAFPHGMYIVKIVSGSMISTHKIIKDK